MALTSSYICTYVRTVKPRTVNIQYYIVPMSDFRHFRCFIINGFISHVFGGNECDNTYKYTVDTGTSWQSFYQPPADSLPSNTRISRPSARHWPFFASSPLLSGNRTSSMPGRLGFNLLYMPYLPAFPNATLSHTNEEHMQIANGFRLLAVR